MINHAAVARGDMPADLVIKNAKIANVFTLDYELADVAVYAGKIAGIADNYDGKEIFDADGKVLIPGMIDGHVHIESTMLAPPIFADEVVKRGTTAVMADPHEISNALGMAGLEYMHNASFGLPIDIFLGAPSCVPASQFETPYEELDMIAIKSMFEDKLCQHLGEMMNFPALIAGDPEVWGKIAAAGDVPLTGHAPNVSGKALNAYLVSGVNSDHECSNLDEAGEKLRRGMWLMIREGASFPNLKTLLPLLKQNPLYYSRCMAITDDVTALYLSEVGHMDAKVKIMINEGLDPLIALRLVTLSPAEYFRLWDRGAIAPGRRADFALIDSLEKFNVLQVWKDGRQVVRDGELVKKSNNNIAMPNINIKITPPQPHQIKVKASGSLINVIGVSQGEVITKTLLKAPLVDNGFVISDTQNDIVKIVVMERHRNTGRLAVGFVNGLGIKRGAIASSVAHDAHNFVAAGVSDAAIINAITELCETGGGFTVAEDNKILGTLPLPIGGLMTNLSAHETADALAELEIRAGELGVKISHPFMALSFLCLSVIPELRITDQGYVDITKGGIQPLFVQ
ncbi:MAG: adenine deaminase [Synergistaceae bacterium]|nr:adenine deaminase [Synergistaceae bacterium]